MALSLPAYSSKGGEPKQVFTASIYEGAGLDGEIKVSVTFLPQKPPTSK